MSPQINCLRGCIFTLVTFLHYVFSHESSDGAHNVLSNVFSKSLRERMQNHTGCTCLTFLHHGFSNVTSNGLPDRMHNHTVCICLTFLRCVFPNESSKHLHKRMQIRTGCICLTFFCHLSLSLESHWLCFYLNLVVQDFDPFLEVCWLLQFLFPNDMLRGYI